MARRQRPYGAWESAITSDLLSGGSVGLLQVKLDGDDVYWLEMRPHEARNVIVRRAHDGAVSDVTPPAFNARTTAHEYGGGNFAVAGGVVWFSNADDGRLYRQDVAGGGAPEPITPEANVRYADPHVDLAAGRLVCVAEDHGGDGEPVNTIVSVPLDGAEPPRTLVAGADFYTFPRVSPDGTRLAWLEWSHPRMPWDSTELYVAGLGPGHALGERTLVAGGPEESVYQPEWSPGGRLHFVSDRTNWWSIYRLDDAGAVELVYGAELELGVPFWWFATPSYGFADEQTLVCSYCEKGMWSLGILDAAAGTLEELDLGYTWVAHVSSDATRAVFLGGSPTQLLSVVAVDLATRTAEVLRASLETPVDPDYLPRPEVIDFPTEGGKQAHAFFYPPSNPRFEGLPGTLPPLVVNVHGGPHNQAPPSLQFGIQWGAACYWTSRGFALLDVNYGGSTGYGREYRERLRGQWGVVDVQDVVNGARWAAASGRVDPDRLAVRGASSGGYTALCAVTFHDVFHAASSVYGLSDLTVFAQDTHKFESRYMDNLVPRDEYAARSPVNAVDRIDAPLIIHQGLDDAIVPPNQAQLIVDALRARGVDVEYLTHEGEGHGFRRAESIKASAEAELRFYGRVFGIDVLP